MPKPVIPPPLVRLTFDEYAKAPSVFLAIRRDVERARRQVGLPTHVERPEPGRYFVLGSRPEPDDGTRFGRIRFGPVSSVDEVSFAGDPKHKPVIQAIIDEARVKIEKKD